MKQLHRRVVVTGLGILSPIGNTLDEAWNSCINGTSGITNIDINLDNNNITGNGSVNITGIITTTNTLHVGTGGTVISASAETGTFAIGSATTSITATMNGGAIPSIGLVIALGG